MQDAAAKLPVKGDEYRRMLTETRKLKATLDKAAAEGAGDENVEALAVMDTADAQVSALTEAWHRATRNECMAEAYGRIVTEPGVEVVRPRPLPGAEGGLSP